MQNVKNLHNLKHTKFNANATANNLNENNENNAINFHALKKDEVLRQLNANEQNGLSENEAQNRLKIYGANKLKEARKKNIIVKFLEQFADFMIIILLAAAAISFVTAFIEGIENGDKSGFLDPIIILIIIIINAIVGVAQEFKAEKSIDELKKLTATETLVLRNNQQYKIKSEFLVPGDIIILEAGDSVPADCRILSNYSASADESALTGESLPVLKDDNLICAINTPLGDRKNMLYMTGVLSSGKCIAVVSGTGMNTEVGKIAGILSSTEENATPLQDKLSKTGKILGITALSVCAFIFVLGLLQKVAPLEMFMLSISLAVAAMPEGLPAIVTIVLAVGVQRMAKNNAIIRKLSAVETLGCATVICSDKTGTLTQNKMRVVENYAVDGDLKKLLSYAVLCNNSRKNSKVYLGDPTETALCEAAEKLSLFKAELDLKYNRLSELPFDSIRKLMSTVNNFGGTNRIITKGAPDILINKCAYYLKDGVAEIMTNSKRNEIERENERMASQALRVIAVAYKDLNVGANIVRPNDKIIENNLIFVGLCGMIDPPREEVANAIKTCRTAGIKPVMITGDHKITAIAIAEKIGIYNKGDKVATGAELDLISDKDLSENIYSYSVFARVSPENKARIVRAFKSRGNIVAMTGDGVNDAPSLKIADMGCAMGKNGTDVARNSADMILADDNFSTIVEAVRQGRGIYDNIKKAIHFLLSSNFGEILTILSAFLLKLPAPLLAIHLLWVNFVTDSLPAIALSSEPPDENIMRRPPINSKKSLFSDGLGLKIIFEGFMIGSLTILGFILGLKYFSLEEARTMAFMTLGISQLVHAYNMRSSKSVFKIGIFKNAKMNLAFIACLALQIGAVVFEPFAAIFRTAHLSSNGWLIVGILSIAPLVIIELQKLFTGD